MRHKNWIIIYKAPFPKGSKGCFSLGPGCSGPHLILGQTEARKIDKSYFQEQDSSISGFGFMPHSIHPPPHPLTPPTTITTHLSFTTTYLNGIKVFVLVSKPATVEVSIWKCSLIFMLFQWLGKYYRPQLVLQHFTKHNHFFSSIPGYHWQMAFDSIEGWSLHTLCARGAKAPNPRQQPHRILRYCVRLVLPRLPRS